MVNVILSWSGDTSKQVAQALYDWIPKVIQRVEPWMSNESIRSGSQWFAELSSALTEARFMIACMTPDNLSSPYIMFEAGAVAKGIGDSFVCPYLYQLDPSQLRPPLTHFQGHLATKDETLKLTQSLNAALKEHALPSSRLDDAFATYWPQLERKLDGVKITGTPAKPPTERELLAEILETVRALSRESSAEVPLLGSGRHDQRLANLGFGGGGLLAESLQPSDNPYIRALQGHLPSPQLIGALTKAIADISAHQKNEAKGGGEVKHEGRGSGEG